MMPRFRPLLAAALAFACLAARPAAAQDRIGATGCSYDTSTAETHECLTRALHTADTEMGRVYRGLMQKTDTSTRPALRAAQRAWIAFRDAECRFEAAESVGGTIHPLEVLACLHETTRARTAQLRRLMRGSQ